MFRDGPRSRPIIGANEGSDNYGQGRSASAGRDHEEGRREEDYNLGNADECSVRVPTGFFTAKRFRSTYKVVYGVAAAPCLVLARVDRRDSVNDPLDETAVAEPLWGLYGHQSADSTTPRAVRAISATKRRGWDVV